MAAMKEDRDFVTALARGIQVLQCFTAQRPELGSTEISALLGLPQSTAWRLCYTLQQIGLLVPGHAPDRLRPGPAVLTLGQAAVTSATLAEAALQPMRQIVAKYGCGVSLAARQGDRMIIVQRVEADSLLRLMLPVGTTLPIDTSALGWAWLAGAPETERQSMLRRIAARQGEAWPLLQQRLEAEFAAYPSSGHVLNLRFYHPDVNAIGVPVVSADGKTVMALNSGDASSFATSELLAGPISAALRVLAEQLSLLIGMTPKS
jgi:DNA-binding IclR family transcriptional regulator